MNRRRMPLLAPICGWFGASCEMGDLREARALLAELSVMTASEARP